MMNKPGLPNPDISGSPNHTISNRSSPSAVVMENSQYRRPSSILSNASAGSDEEEDLPRNIMGSIFLMLHLLISMLMIFINLAVVGFEIASLCLGQKISSVPEIPEFVTFILVLVSSIGLLITVKAPMWLFFGSSKTFRSYCFKDNFYLKYASFMVLAVGLVAIAIHLYLYFQPDGTSHITPFLPAGFFLILNSLLNLKLHRELLDGGAREETIMLPYTPERKDADAWMFEEMSDITGSDRV